MPLIQALEMARKQGLDVIEVAPTAVPPVCRLLDYGKYKYTQAKKERELRKGQHVAELREIRLRPKIGDHDFGAKVRSASKLLEGGDKVKVSVIFRGREVTHPQIGLRLIQRMAESLKEVASIDRQPSMENPRALSLILSPLATQKTRVKEVAKEEAKESLDAKA